MAFDTQRNTWARSQAEGAVIDGGLRQYMLRVYNYMASGLALTGIAAYLVDHTPQLFFLFYQIGPGAQVTPTAIGWIVMFAPIGLVLLLSMGVNRLSAQAAQGVFWAYAALMGVSLSSIFAVYTGTSITRVFFITAASFSGLSLWGYTTRRNLDAFGSFLVMGLWGLVVASLVNIFLASSMMNFVTSVLGVLIFAGLTAYDTQKIKEMYWEGDGSETASKKAIMGALTLYLDFINMFMLLLRFFGDRRE